MPETDYNTEHEREAFRLGVQAAESAASWTVNGNTSSDHVVRVLAMLKDGDPVADEYLPARPNLSGEWADAPTPYTLARDITGQDSIADDWETVDAIADAWEAGVSETFQPAMTRRPSTSPS
jgi:hypothetical protein